MACWSLAFLSHPDGIDAGSSPNDAGYAIGACAIINPEVPTTDKPGMADPAAARLRELHERLVIWWYGSSVEGSELKGVWEDAYRRFDQRMRQLLEANGGDEELMVKSPPDLALQCLEAALSDFDNILAAFPHSLPEGWYEWLPLPPEE